MTDYPNLDMLVRGGCGPTSDWIRVIPEIKALRQELDDLATALNGLRLGLESCTQRRQAAEAMTATLVEALEEIAKAEGRFSQDHVTHAENTIEDMQALAVAALAAAKAGHQKPR